MLIYIIYESFLVILLLFYMNHLFSYYYSIFQSIYVGYLYNIINENEESNLNVSMWFFEITKIISKKKYKQNYRMS